MEFLIASLEERDQGNVTHEVNDACDCPLTRAGVLSAEVSYCGSQVNIALNIVKCCHVNLRFLTITLYTKT